MSGVVDLSSSALDLDRIENQASARVVYLDDTRALCAEVRRLRKEIDRLISPKPRPLSKRQAEVLAFAQAYIDVKKISPTLREICEGLGLRSEATVHEHLVELERKHWIVRADNDQRSIEIRVRI